MATRMDWVLLFLMSVSAEAVRANHYGLAFAGGGFGRTSSKKSSYKNKGSKRKRAGGFADLHVPPPIKSQDDVTDSKLDKWGLPMPTEEDLFPTMPDGTEFIAASTVSEASLEDIQAALSNHILLDLESFDSSGIEREPSPGKEAMKLKMLHKSPPVLSIENFLSVDECDQTQDVANVDDASLQVDSATFSPLAMSRRTSTSWFCYFAQMPSLLAKARYRLGIPFAQMEEPQIVRYRAGEEFSWHYDEVPPTQLSNGGQRLATLLVYLKTVQRGGSTIFRDLKDPNGQPLTVKPVQGSALMFFPAFADGTPDDRTLHKGELAHDEKWIAQMWIHQHDYKPVVPPGNSQEAARSAIEQECEKLGYQ